MSRNYLENGPWWQAETPSSHNSIPDFSHYLEQLQDRISNTREELKEHQCPKCKEMEFSADPETGFISCYNCGWMGEQWIDSGQEWRVYSSDDHHRAGYDPGRVGSFIHEDFRKSSLSTCIKGTNGNASIRRIQQYQSMDQKERRLYQSYRLLKDATPSGGQVNQQTCEKAKNIFKSVNESKQRPSNRRTSMAAAVYLASREDSQDRVALEDISNMFAVQRKKIHKVYKNSREVLFQKNAETAKKWAPSDAKDEIDRIIKWVGPCDSSWIESAKELASIAKDNGFGLYTIPASLALGCLWWVYQEMKEEITMEELAKSVNCSPGTVSRSYQALAVNKVFIDSLRKIFPIQVEKNPQKSHIKYTDDVILSGFNSH